MALSQGVSAFFVLVAVIFCIVALATPAWLVYSSGPAEAQYGPFMGKFCPTSDTCSKFRFEVCKIKGDIEDEVEGDQCDHLRAAQAFGLLAVLSYILALILIIVMFACKKTALGYITAIFTIAGGIFGIICMGVVVDKLKKDLDEDFTGADFKYGYSFALMTVAWILALIDGIIMFVASYQAGKTA